MAFHIKVDNRTSGPTDTGPAGGSVRSWSKNQTFNGQTFFSFSFCSFDSHFECLGAYELYTYW